MAEARPARPRCAVVLAHPRSDSFCAALAVRARTAAENAGYSAVFRDLYANAFDPLLRARDLAIVEGGHSLAPDVELEVSLLGEPVAVVLVYPIWFGGPPAILKGYVERVLGAGVAGPGSVPNSAGPRPRLLLTIASSGATGAWIREKGIAGSAGRLFGAYLAAALDIARAEHIAIEKVHAFMPKSDAEAALARVERRVGETLAALRSILPQDQGESLARAAPTA